MYSQVYKGSEAGFQPTAAQAAQALYEFIIPLEQGNIYNLNK